MVSSRGIFKSNDMRICLYCIEYMKANRVELPLSGLSDPKDCCLAINRALDYYFPGEVNDELRANFVGEMKANCHACIIDVDNFSWVEENEMACYWLWGYLYSSNNADLSLEVSGNVFEPPYKNMMLDPLPSNTKERLRAIIGFFDGWKKDGTFKVTFLKERLKEWQGIFEGRNGRFKWLDKNNEEQCSWAWKYTKNAQYEIAVKLNSTGEIDMPSTYLRPLSPLEEYMAVHISIYLWRVNSIGLDSYISAIGKAWSQRKLRAKREGTKALNTNLKAEVKDKLDELAQHHDKKISEILEVIILAEYKRMKSGIQ